MRYHAFISYSHGADARLAPALQRALHRFAKPWWKARAVSVFRDETSLALAHSLPDVLTKALAASEHFILMASPLAAQSKWVAGECEWWTAHKPAERMLVVLSEGEIAWDEAAGDFDWAKTTALPPALKGVFKHEPLYLDLRWTKSAATFSDRDPRFLDAVARISAALRGMSLEAIAGEEVRQHRKTRRVAYAAVSAIALLAAGASAGAWIATENAREAERQRDRAGEERDRAEKSLEEAVKAASALAVELADGFQDFEGISVEWRERLLRTAESIYSRLSKLGDSAQLRYHRATTAISFAQMYFSFDAWKEAREWAGQARKLLQDPPAEGLLRVMFQDKLLLAHISLGDVKFAEAEFKQALEDYHAALSLSDDSAKLAGRDDQWARQRSIVHERLGQAKLKLGETAGALAEYEVARAMLEELAEQNPARLEAQRDLSVLHEKIGSLKLAQKDYAGALEGYAAALRIVARLAVDTRNTRWQQDESRLQLKIGEVHLIQRRYELALKEFGSALETRKRLAFIDPRDWPRQRDLAVVHGRIGDAKAAQRNQADAIQSYRASSAVYREVTRENPLHRAWRRERWAILVKLGMAEAEIQDYPTALEDLRAALEISDGLTSGGTAGEDRDLYYTLTRVGLVSEARKDWATARASYARAQTVVARMLDKYGDSEGWRNDRDWIAERLRKVDEQPMPNGPRPRATQ